ncbi:MAG: c-type cytochrome [Betaproteobacteria bacterium]|nr:c-type cytochrome [Betaproteobacteria bacterium]
MNRLMLAGVLSVLLIGCTDKEPSSAKVPAEKAAGNVGAGKIVAEQNCKSCHGLDGKGAAPGIPHLAAQGERYLLESIKEYREGKRSHATLRDMTGHMSEAQLRDVVAYYASRPPIASVLRKDVQLVSPYERGKAQAAACAKCHGEDGNSTTPGIPSLAGQQPHYLVVAIQEYHQGDRGAPAMKSMLRGANKMELESLALYLSSQVPAQRGAPPFGDPAAGEPLTAVCGGCHGSRGVSTDAATPTLAGQDAQYLLAAIKGYRKTRRHETMERQVGALSDRDIENITAFYTVQKSRPAERGQTLVEQLAEKCDRCHGPGVDNPAMAIPKISGQDKDYLTMALRAYRDDRRESSAMHRMSLPFSDAIIESIASRYASQPAK